MHMKVNECTALIDKVTFSHVMIKDIENIEKLIELDVVKRKEDEDSQNPKKRYVTYSGQKFDYLHIKNDEMINDLKVGINPKSKKAYGTMQLSVKNSSGNNLICNSVEDFRRQLEATKAHIKVKYGIEIDLSDLTLKKIEINKTFRLDGAFDDYKRVFKFIMGVLPPKSYLNTQGEFRKKNNNGYEYQTFYARTSRNNKQEYSSDGQIRKPKQYLELKIYNKTQQLMGLILLDDDYLRLEFSIVNSQKIKREFGTNRFDMITDEKINAWFDTKIDEWIVKPLQKFKAERDKKVLKLMKEQLKIEKHWVSNVIGILQNQEVEQDYPVLLDVEELIPLVDSLGIDRPGRVKNSFRRQATKIQTVLSNRDDLKLAEIIEKLTRKDTSNKQPVPPVQDKRNWNELAEKKVA